VSIPQIDTNDAMAEGAVPGLRRGPPSVTFDAEPQPLEKAVAGFGLAFLLPAVLGHNSDLDIVG
jgi:hypothetical protein